MHSDPKRNLPVSEWVFVPVRLFSEASAVPSNVQNVLSQDTLDFHKRYKSSSDFIDEDVHFDLLARFQYYNGLYFDGLLSSCECKWSTRMTLCAGQCHYHPRSGYCSIRLSAPLLQYRSKADCIDTLLHEMIHVRDG
jgi:hypothetical protein